MSKTFWIRKEKDGGHYCLLEAGAEIRNLEFHYISDLTFETITGIKLKPGKAEKFKLVKGREKKK